MNKLILFMALGLILGCQGKNGAPGSNGKVGAIGNTGAVGASGSNGQDGYNSLVSTARVETDICPSGSGVEVDSGLDLDRSNTLEVAETTQTTVVCDGEKGDQGAAGADAPVYPYSIVAIIDPCGAATNYDEVLLRLENDQILAHFSSGTLQYLTIIGPGSYVTTDAQQCHFVVHDNLSVTW